MPVDSKERQAIVDAADLLGKLLLPDVERGGTGDDAGDVRHSSRHYLTRNLLVDDFENIAPVEYELVTRLIGPKQSVTVATDPDQRIYDWRGLLPDPSAKFAEDYPNATRYELRSVHRVPSRGLPPLRDMTKRRDLRETRECARTSIEIPEPPFFEVVDVVGRPPEQYERIAHDVKRLISGGWLKAEEIAILARRRGTLMRLCNLLDAHRVPFTRLGGLAGRPDPDVRSVAGMLSLVVNPRSVPHFLDACSGNPETGRRGLHRKFAADVINAAKEDDADLIDGVRVVQKHVGPSSGVHTYLTGFEKTYTSVVTILRAHIVSVRGMVHTAYKGVYAAEGRDVPEKNARSVEELHRWARFEDSLSKASGTETDISGFLKFIDRLNHDTSIGAPSIRSTYSLDRDRGVSLGSLHSAKGLEWKLVIVPDVAEHVLPGSEALGHTADTAREFRLLKQATLRASERCALYWSHEREDGTAASLSSFINPDG